MLGKCCFWQGNRGDTPIQTSKPRHSSCYKVSEKKCLLVACMEAGNPLKGFNSMMREWSQCLVTHDASPPTPVFASSTHILLQKGRCSNYKDHEGLLHLLLLSRRSSKTFKLATFKLAVLIKYSSSLSCTHCKLIIAILL